MEKSRGIPQDLYKSWTAVYLKIYTDQIDSILIYTHICHIFLHLCTCLSAYLPVCLSVYLQYLSVYQSAYLELVYSPSTMLWITWKHRHRRNNRSPLLDSRPLTARHHHSIILDSFHALLSHQVFKWATKNPSYFHLTFHHTVCLIEILIIS